MDRMASTQRAVGGSASGLMPERALQVGQQLNTLGHRLEEVHGQVDLLVSRLCMVVRSVSEGKDSRDGPVAVETLVPLADTLRSTNNSLDVLAAKLRALLDGLEL